MGSPKSFLFLGKKSLTQDSHSYLHLSLWERADGSVMDTDFTILMYIT